METPKCIHCSSEYTYELSDTSFGCSECGNEFTLEEIEAARSEERFSRKLRQLENLLSLIV